MRKITLLIIVLFGFKVYSQCYSKISAGAAHTIAVNNSNVINIWGNGSLGWGALGQGDDFDVLAPIPLSASFNGGFVFAGPYNTFIIKSNGTLWASGNDQYGQLGDGTYGFAHVFHNFIQIGNASNWKYIAASTDHTLGIKTDGTLWAWGNNSYGELGDGTNAEKHTPVQVGTENNWKTVEAGLFISVGIKNDGTLWGWGDSSSGSLGMGTSGSLTYNTPTQIGTDNDWKSISIGIQGLFTLALKNNGALYVFGSGWSGGFNPLGLGPDINIANTPTQIGIDTDWKFINSGYNNSFSIKNNGTLWAWGQNDYGQLGDGTTIDKVIPTQIGTDNDWSIISGGLFHTVALKSNGALYTWGDNTYAQLGNGSYLSNLTPYQISSCSLGEEQFNFSKILISPNPANEVFNITSNGDLDFDKILIFDICGRLILAIDNITTKNISISLNNYSSGLYTILVERENQIISVEKVLKK